MPHISSRCLVDDPNDLTPWYYTAMLTGRGGDAGKREASAERVGEATRDSHNPGHRAIHEWLCGLINERQVRTVIERRTLLTHRALVEYRSGKGKWRIVTAERRAQEYFETAGV